MFIAVPVAMTFCWVLYLLFGYFIPYGFILAITLVVIGIFLPSLITQFPSFAIITFILAGLYMISVVITIPAIPSSFSLNIYILDAVQWFDGVVNYFGTIINFGPLETKIKRFDYRGLTSVPTLDNFCFGITFGNLGLAYIVYRFTPAVMIFVVAVISGLISFIFSSMLILYNMYLTTLSRYNQGQVSVIKGQMQVTQKSLDKTKLKFKALKKNLTPGFMSNSAVASRSPAQPAQQPIQHSIGQQQMIRNERPEEKKIK